MSVVEEESSKEKTNSRDCFFWNKTREKIKTLLLETRNGFYSPCIMKLYKKFKTSHLKNSNYLSKKGTIFGKKSFMKKKVVFYLIHLIQTTNTNLEFLQQFLFTYFVSKYWQDKSFKLRPKYIKKCQYNSLHKENKNTLQHLKLGKLKFGIGKIGCLMSWTRYKFRMIVIYTMKRLCCAVLGAALGNHHITIEWLSKTRVTSRYVSSKSILSSKISTQQKHSN